jgi:hypothetical protein
LFSFAPARSSCKKFFWGISYGILIGLGFLASPVVKSLGVGPFGVDFGWPFAAIVLTAHAAFGAALVLLLRVMTSGPRHRSVVLESAAHREHAPPQACSFASRDRL